MVAFSIARLPLPSDTPTMPMILAANANAQGSHVGEWRHRDAWDKPAANIANAMRLAQIARGDNALNIIGLEVSRQCRQFPFRNDWHSAVEVSLAPTVGCKESKKHSQRRHIGLGVAEA